MKKLSRLLLLSFSLLTACTICNNAQAMQAGIDAKSREEQELEKILNILACNEKEFSKNYQSFVETLNKIRTALKKLREEGNKNSNRQPWEEPNGGHNGSGCPEHEEEENRNGTDKESRNETDDKEEEEEEKTGTARRKKKKKKKKRNQ